MINNMPSFPLKIVSLNIEMDRHFDRIIPFLKEQKPDVILLQEVFEKDIPYLEKHLEMKLVFTAAIKYLLINNEKQKLGTATFSNLEITKHYSDYYHGDGRNLPVTHYGEAEKGARSILVVEVVKDHQFYCLVNTHFSWTPNGKPDAQQHKDLTAMLYLLSKIPEFILCGDFNTPRGMPIFDAIAHKYKDNIPSYIRTTIDKNLHRAGDLQLVVDGLFTTLPYHVDSIEVVNNLSDHCAILATISKLAI